MRDGSPLDVPIMLFWWDKQRDMHVSRGEKSEEERERPMQDYALAHEASIRELYKQLFGEELEHVTPSHDTLNRALQVTFPTRSSSRPI